MDTNELIEKLSKDLPAVRVMRAPLARAAAASLVGLAAVAVAVRAFRGPRIDVRAAFENPEFLVGDLMMLAAGVLAAVAAAQLAVPDTKVRRAVSLPLGLATGLWGLLSAWSLLHMTATDFPPDVHEPNTCVQGLVFLSLAPVGIALILALRGAPVWRGLAGYALTLSMASFAALGMRFLCADDAPGHLFFWHYLPVLALALCGIGLGRIVLGRRRT